MNEQRAEFEAFVRSELGDVPVMDGGKYISPKIHNYWRLWEHASNRTSRLMRLAEAVDGIENAATQRQQERIAELEAQVSTLTTALFDCREAFPIPEPGSPLEPAWMGAMTDPEDVPEYVKAQVQALSVDAERYQFAIDSSIEYGRLNFKAIYDAWDGDGSFTDQIDAAIAAGKGEG